MYGNSNSFFDKLKGKWGLIGAVVVILSLVAGFTVPSINQGDEIAANTAQIAANEAVMATDTELADAVAPLATKAELAAVDATLQTHLVAYAVFVEVVSDAIDDFTDEVINIWNWIDDFNMVWADFQEQYQGDIANLHATMASWGTYVAGLIPDTSLLEDWAEAFDDWADTPPANWDDYPEFTE